MAINLNRAPRLSAVPLSLISDALPRLSRDALEGLVEHLIDRLDAMAPDADLEANGDEQDGTYGEDEFLDHKRDMGAYGGPGCPIADPDLAVDDEPCDEPYQDLEIEQMAGDVPTVPLCAIEPDDSGRRRFLGHWDPGSFVNAGKPMSASPG